MDLQGRNILITGAAVRVGRAMALAVAKAGATVLIHFGESKDEAEKLQAGIKQLGRDSYLLQADLRDEKETTDLIPRALEHGPLFGLVNSASIFEKHQLEETDLETWRRHMDINLTAPFILSQAFWKAAKESSADGRIVNILDWRALRPGPGHFAYTISKAALAAMTHSLAIATAPKVTVNGMAFGAILPPTGGAAPNVLKSVPAGRWAELDEVGQTLLFFLTGPSYITGEIIYLDGGRHLI